MVKKTAKQRAAIARKNGASGGRPPKHGEPTRLMAAKVPASVGEAFDAKAAAQGLSRSEAIVVAMTLWLKR